jgi:hypothetical protein
MTFFEGFSVFAGTHKVGCPKFLTKFESCFVVPDQNDARSSQEFCGEYGTEFHRTVAHDGNCFSGLHARANRRKYVFENCKVADKVKILKNESDLSVRSEHSNRKVLAKTSARHTSAEFVDFLAKIVDTHRQVARST